MDGSGTAEFHGLYEALLEAKGVSLGVSGGKAPRQGGRSLSYTRQNSVQRQPAWWARLPALLDLKPGE